MSDFRFFDPHAHMTSRTTDDYERMAKAGVRALIEPAFWLGQPRTNVGSFVDYFSSLEGRIVGTAAEFVEAGVPDFSLNTDSSVVPQEEFFLQGTMSARHGGDAYTMLEAMTRNPAKVFMLDHRVGSLEVGKDADVVLLTGDPLDPREAVETVLIDGKIEYDRGRDGQWF